LGEELIGNWKPLIGPGAHHGATPTKDPRVAGVTAGGDYAQPVDSRPRQWPFIIAMVLVVVLAFVAWRVVVKPAGSDAKARAAASGMGLTVADGWNVATIDGGFRLVRSSASKSDPGLSGYYFDIVLTSTVSPPADASTWNPKIAGATAYAEGNPPYQLLIDAGVHKWIVTSGARQVLGGDLSPWYDLQNSITFTSGD
jgi:hypothetical protein